MNSASFIFTVLTLMPFTTLKSQKLSNSWLIGYSGETIDSLDDFGITKLKFNDFGKVIISNDFKSPASFDGTNVSISDTLGQLLFYYNGSSIYNANHHIIENGDTLNVDDISGENIPQGAVILPWNNHPGEYWLFHMTGTYVPGETKFIGTELYYSVVNMNLNDGLGAVTRRKVKVLEDNLFYGKLTATKHANGRDWWILLPDQIGNKAKSIYTVLFSNSEELIVENHSLDIDLYQGLGQSCISPNGELLSYFCTIGDQVGQFLDIFDFDRCTGIVSNQRQLHYQLPNIFSGGIAISQNSRFLYTFLFNKIYQYDLFSSNIFESESLVAEYDGFVDPLFPVPTYFYLGQLAPNGKIYISVPNGVHYLHHIDYPNKKGIDCRVVQHGTILPNYNGYSIPYFPNFTLGSIEDSFCDTLLTSNLPVANFRADSDSLENLKVNFVNLSYNEPYTSFWEFGDGSTSTLIEPTHIYENSGTFQVCLTISNNFGVDIACDSVWVDFNVNMDVPKQEMVRIFPNPMIDNLRIIIIDKIGNSNAAYSMYNLLGNKVIGGAIENDVNYIDVSSLPAGVYTIQIHIDKLVVFVQKVAKIN